MAGDAKQLWNKLPLRTITPPLKNSVSLCQGQKALVTIPEST